MKMRARQVSNSSSASFILAGFHIPNDVLINIANKLGINTDGDEWQWNTVEKLDLEIRTDVGGEDFEEPFICTIVAAGDAWTLVEDIPAKLQAAQNKMEAFRNEIGLPDMKIDTVIETDVGF